MNRINPSILKLQEQCTHKMLNGDAAIEKYDKGGFYCRICGKEITEENSLIKEKE